jgi:hypothetical protein
VIVLESEVFPRPHIGESLVPTTTPVLEQIGAMEKVDKAGFPRKYGAAWTSAAPKSIPKLGFTGMSHDFNFSHITFSERKQGQVYDEVEPKVLGEMRKLVQEVEGNPHHLWRKYLGTLQTPVIAPAF